MPIVQQPIPNALLLASATLEEAKELAKQLLGPDHVHKIDSNNHPDIHYLIPDEKSGLHSMASIQKMIQEVAFPPFEAKCKIIMIEKADQMLPASSNALLKTLEEPDEKTYFFLLTDHKDKLLPTIQSRLHPFAFSEKKIPSFDMSPYFAMALSDEWDKLFDALPILEAEDPDALFQGCLSWAAEQEDSRCFIQMSEQITQSQKALSHNLKLRTILLNILAVS